MRRAVAILLACLLMMTFLANAQASSRNIPDSLKRHSYLTDTFETAELTSRTRTRKLTMEEGEYVTIAPIHKIRVNYLSYSLNSISNSNPGVVGVKFIQQEDGKLGLSLHAIKAGDATITASFRTYRSKLGMKYEDKRRKTVFSQQIDVHVKAQGTVTMKLTLKGNGYSSLKGVTLRLQNMKELMSVDQITDIRGYIQEAVDEYRNIIIDTLKDIITGEVFDMAADNAETILSTFTKHAGKLIKGIKGAMGAMDLIGKVKSVMTNTDRIRKAYLYAKYATMWIPTYYPKSIELSVAIENKTENTIRNVTLSAEADSHISFMGITDVKGLTMPLGSDGVIGPGEKREYTIPVYPEFVYGKLCQDPSSPIEAYSAKISVRCFYTSDDMKETVQKNDQIVFPVYTTIDLATLQKFKQAILQEYNTERVDAFTSALLGGTFNGYRKWYGFDRFDQVFSFACPVDIYILNAEGEELAVLKDDGTVFTDEVLTAYSENGQKYITVPENTVSNYRIGIQATDQGRMDVTTFSYDEKSGIQANVFEQVALEEGEQFVLNCQEGLAADLARAEHFTERERIEPTQEIRQEDILAGLTDEGYTEEEAQALVDMSFLGIYPETMTGEADDQMDINTWCEMLVRLANLCGLHVIPEETGEGFSWIQTATDYGFLPEETESGKNDFTLTVGTAIKQAQYLLGTLGFSTEDDTPIIVSENDDESETAENTEPIENPPSPGVLKKDQLIRARDAFITAGTDELAPLTNGTAVLLAHRVARYMETNVQGNNLIKAVAEAYENSLDWYDDRRPNGLYAMDSQNGADQLVQNSGWWHPAFLRADDAIDIVNQMFIALSRMTRNKEARKIYLGKKVSLTFEEGTLFGSLFQDDDGDLYAWQPFFCRNDEGTIQDDRVYLHLIRTADGADMGYIDRYQMKTKHADNRLFYYVVADQDVVAAVLNEFSPICPGQLIEEGSADSLLEEWIERHCEPEQVEAGMRTLIERGGKDPGKKDLARIISGGMGYQQAEIAAREIPADIVELYGGLPQDISLLKDLHPFEEIEKLSETMYPYLAREVLFTGRAQVENQMWPGKIHDVCFTYTTENEQGEISMKYNRYPGYDDFMLEEKLPEDEIIQYSFVMDYDDQDRNYHIIIRESESYTTLTEVFSHPDYANIRYEITRYKSEYGIANHVLKLTAEDTDGTKYIWSTIYDENGNNRDMITYQEED